MTKFEQARLDAFQRAQSFMTKYNDELVTVEEYGAEKTAFDEKVGEIEDAAQNEEVDTVVITEDKKVDREMVAEVMFKYMQRASMKGYQMGATELAAALDKPKGYIGEAKDGEVVTHSTEMKNLMRDNRVAILTNITADNITEMEGVIGDCAGIKGKNREAVKSKKANGTDVIVGLEDEADVPKLQVQKIVYGYFPARIAEWDLMVKVGKVPGIRHLDAVVKYVDDETGIVLYNVLATWSKMDVSFTRLTTKLGYTRGYGLENGNWNITGELTGYVTSVLPTVGVEEGKIFRVVVRMKKV